MPMAFSEEKPNGSYDIHFELGHNDIGVGYLDGENGAHGVGLWQLTKVYASGELDKAEIDNGYPKVFLVVRDLKGLSTLRRIVRGIEHKMGHDNSTLADKVADGFLDTIGEAQQRATKAEFHANAIAKENAEAFDDLGKLGGEALVMRRVLEWLRYKGDNLTVAKQVAANALDYLGYTRPTDDTVLGEIYSAPFMQRDVAVEGYANVPQN